MAQVVTQARVGAHREGGAHLHPLGARGDGRLQGLGRTRAAGQPEWPANRLHLFEIDDVARAVLRFTAIVLRPRAARRRIVAAGGRAFHDEAVDVAVRLASEGEREDVGGDDGEEPRPGQRRQRAAEECLWIEAEHHALVGARARDRERVGRRLVVHEAIEHRRDAHRDAGAHQHVVDAGQHRAVDRGQVRRLDLLEVVDADGIGVSFLCQIDLDEVGDHDQRLPGHRRLVRAHLHAAPGLAIGLAAGNVVGVPDVFGELRHGEVIERAAHVAARIALLQAARQHLVEGRAADHAELTFERHRPRQPPVRDPDTHAALDDAHDGIVPAAAPARP